MSSIDNILLKKRKFFRQYNGDDPAMENPHLDKSIMHDEDSSEFTLSDLETKSELRQHSHAMAFRAVIRFINSQRFIDMLCQSTIDSIRQTWEPRNSIKGFDIDVFALCNDLDEAVKEIDKDDSIVQCRPNNQVFVSMHIGMIDHKWDVYCEFLMNKNGQVNNFEVGDFD